MRNVNLDVALLRTFVLAHRLGGLTQAADVVGRTPSAVSQQISRLEELLGHSLFQREGRRTALTEAGVLALSYAERMLGLNDELVDASRGVEANAEIRLGVSVDFSAGLLHELLRQFRERHPTSRLSIVTERRTSLSERLSAGSLDLALMFGIAAGEAAETLGRVQQVWVGHRDILDRSGSIPLVVFQGHCEFRTTALRALAEAGIAAHIAVTCSDLPALWVAVESGCGIALRTAIGAPERLLLDTSGCGLPSLPEVHVGLHRSPRGFSRKADQLQRLILAALPGRLEAFSSTASKLARPVGRPVDEPLREAALS
jgi:DNA-binding transcriptional LysR family regulator